MTPRWARERRKGRSLRRQAFDAAASARLLNIANDTMIYLHREEKPDWWG